ncbi:MAG: type II secretion system GspH family protein [bacterium]|nr:type II secretion system GspH family protein [bacterium]
MQKGFTLAEVLVTLTIIGVVAALTLPTLNMDINKREKSVRLQKFYNVMDQTIRLSEMDHGRLNRWDNTLNYETYLKEYITPYLKATIVGKGNDAHLEFPDGSSMTFYKGGCLDFIYDVNGPNKGKNTHGYDVFRFLACATDANGLAWCDGQGGFCTYRESVMDKSNRSSLLNKCKSNAAYCSALLEYDGWEFKNDYPFK